VDHAPACTALGDISWEPMLAAANATSMLAAAADDFGWE